MTFLSEAQLEPALLEQLAALGYACCTSDDIIGPDGSQPERATYKKWYCKHGFKMLR